MIFGWKAQRHWFVRASFLPSTMPSYAELVKYMALNRLYSIALTAFSRCFNTERLSLLETIQEESIRHSLGGCLVLQTGKVASGICLTFQVVFSYYSLVEI